MLELFNAMPGLMARFADNDQVLNSFVFAAWRKIAGDQLRQRTEPLAFGQKRLTIAVENAIWKRHLEDLSGDMLYRLNSALGQGVINFIEFGIDEKAVIEAPDRRLVRSTGNTVIPPVPKEVKNAALGIKDEKLRESFLNAAGLYLSR